MTTDQLYLNAERLAQFNAALGAGALDALLGEAESEVEHYTVGYTIEQPVLDGWTRIICLHKAYLAAEFSVPKDIETGYSDTMTELRAIADGKRAVGASGAGDWGSNEQVDFSQA